VKRFSHALLHALLIALGILSAGMGIRGFLLSSNFIDGGVTGVSMLVSKVTGTPLSIWVALVNLPFHRSWISSDRRRVRPSQRRGHRRLVGGARDGAFSRRDPRSPLFDDRFYPVRVLRSDPFAVHVNDQRPDGRVPLSPNHSKSNVAA